MRLKQNPVHCGFFESLPDLEKFYKELYYLVLYDFALPVSVLARITHHLDQEKKGKKIKENVLSLLAATV